jgi:hypothetical protein
MVEIGKIGRIKVDLLDFLLFSIDINDILYGLHSDMARQLLLFAKNVSDLDMEAKLEASKGRITVECDGLKTLYFEDEESKPGCRYLAIARLECSDGVDYFIAFSDTAGNDYIHYIEYVDRNRESQGHLYDDVTEFIYINEWDYKPELVDQWIKMFRNPKILDNFPEFGYVVMRLEWLKERLEEELEEENP